MIIARGRRPAGIAGVQDPRVVCPTTGRLELEVQIVDQHRPARAIVALEVIPDQRDLEILARHDADVVLPCLCRRKRVLPDEVVGAVVQANDVDGVLDVDAAVTELEIRSDVALVLGALDQQRLHGRWPGLTAKLVDVVLHQNGDAAGHGRGREGRTAGVAVVVVAGVCRGDALVALAAGSDDVRLEPPVERRPHAAVVAQVVIVRVVAAHDYRVLGSGARSGNRPVWVVGQVSGAVRAVAVVAGREDYRQLLALTASHELVVVLAPVIVLAVVLAVVRTQSPAPRVLREDDVVVGDGVAVLVVHVTHAAGPVVGGDVHARGHSGPLIRVPAVDRTARAVTGHHAADLRGVAAYRGAVPYCEPAVVVVVVRSRRAVVPHPGSQARTAQVVGRVLNLVGVDVVPDLVVILDFLRTWAHHVLDDVLGGELQNISVEQQREGVPVPVCDLPEGGEDGLSVSHVVVHEGAHDLPIHRAPRYLVACPKCEHRPHGTGVERLHGPSPHESGPGVVGDVVEQDDPCIRQLFPLRVCRDLVELNDEM